MSTKAASLNASLASLSHDMRTPLGVIMGHIDLIKGVPTNVADQEKSLEAISKNLDELTDLINNFLDSSELEEKKNHSCRRLDGRKILVVDDSADNRQLLSRMLQIEGAQIETACDGIEGLRSALKGAHDLVLMDLQMPNMDGCRATQALRALGFHQPILALTANALRAERERCLTAGCTDHMTKPVHREDLIRKISTLLPEPMTT